MNAPETIVVAGSLSGKANDVQQLASMLRGLRSNLNAALGGSAAQTTPMSAVVLRYHSKTTSLCKLATGSSIHSKVFVNEFISMFRYLGKNTFRAVSDDSEASRFPRCCEIAYAGSTVM